MKQLLTILFIGVISVKGQKKANQNKSGTVPIICPIGTIILNQNDEGDRLIRQAIKEDTFYMSIPGATLTPTRIYGQTCDSLIYWNELVFPHYDTLPKFDTIKVRIMYEQGESVVPIIIRGYQVRQFIKWNPGDRIFHYAYSYKPEPDKWIDTDIFLFEDKTRIDNTRKWGSKQRSW